MWRRSVGMLLGACAVCSAQAGEVVYVADEASCVQRQLIPERS
ncbi:MAG: hypothetical protein WC053_04390 [Sideroxydans sp.]|jgi:hypothetical protein